MGTVDELVAKEIEVAGAGVSASSTAVQITNEFVRSYGFKGNPDTGEWSWSTDNIKESFKEHPFLSAIDYLTFAVPVAKWGLAAARITRGVGAIGKAYKAGEFGEAGFTAISKAAKLEHSLPPRSKIAQAFYSPVNIDPEAVKILRKYGGDPRDQRALGYFVDRERRAQLELVRRSHAEIQRKARRVDPDMGERVTKLLEMPTSDDPDAWGAAWGALDRSGQDLYLSQFQFRNWLHESSYHYGLISEDTYKKNLERYVPRGYEEFEKILGETRVKVWGSGNKVPWEEGAKHFMARTAEDHPELTRILDPKWTTDAMARASMVVTQQAYAIGLARNGLLKSAGELDELVAAGKLAPEERGMWGRVIDLFPGKVRPTSSPRIRALEREKKLFEKRASLHKRVFDTSQSIIFGQAEKVAGLRHKSAMRYLLNKFPEYFDDAGNFGRGAREATEDVWRRAEGARGAQFRRGTEEARRAEEGGARRLGEHADDSRLPSTEFARGEGGRKGRLGKVGIARAHQRTKDLNEELNRLTRGDRSAWKRFERALNQEGRRLQRDGDRIEASLARAKENLGRPMFVKRLPTGETATRLGLVGTDGRPLDLAHMFVDPAVAGDLRGVVSLGEQNVFGKFYDGALRWFKISHTAYNPATQSRNFLGNAIFHMLATGIRGFPVPLKGIRAWKKQGAEFFEGLEAGIIGGGVDKITFDNWTKVYEPEAGEAVGSWISNMVGAGKFAKAVRGADDAARRMYLAGDEVWKMDAWLKLRSRYDKKLLASGVTNAAERKDRAIEMATLDVMRYFPNYLQTSALTDMMGKVIPFFGFTSEAVRVWKNAMTYRPASAFFLQRWAEIGSHTLAAMSGLNEDEITAAREALPWYTQGRKMLLWPFRGGDRKVSFLDLSYIMPGAEIGAEAEAAESSFWGVPVPTSLVNFAANPFLGMFAAAYTGDDPFTGRPLAPRALEQAGATVTGSNERRLLGLGEYVARAMLPPLMPPNYVGMNLIDAATGRKSGVTGEELQAEIGRTVAANLFGLRTYEPTVQAQIVNLRREQRLSGEEVSASWDRWELAMANGDFTRAQEEQRRIAEMKGVDFFNKNFKRHIPGAYNNIGVKDIDEIIRRSLRFEADPGELWPVWARHLEATSKQRRK